MVVVIDYKAGNLYNVGNALKYLGVEYTFSGDPSVVARAKRVILPGVGSARPAMESLREQDLVDVIRRIRVPFLGICLGLQLLFERSEEDDTTCLGVLPGTICRFDSSHVKVPHIGWNQVRRCSSIQGGRLFQHIPDQSYFYFVHSYCAPIIEEGTTLGTTSYGDHIFASAVARDNFCAVQFHPERSGAAGLRLLKNFLEIE